MCHTDLIRVNLLPHSQLALVPFPTTHQFNWETGASLAAMQVKYAALDAVCTEQVFRRLTNRPMLLPPCPCPAPPAHTHPALKQAPLNLSAVAAVAAAPPAAY